VGAVDRALYELLNIDVYGLLGLDVASYGTASCPALGEAPGAIASTGLSI